MRLPTIPKVILRQNGETDPSRQVLAVHDLTVFLWKKPVLERDLDGQLSSAPLLEEGDDDFVDLGSRFGTAGG